MVEIIVQFGWHKRSSARNKLKISLLTLKNVLTYLRISDSDEQYRCAIFFKTCFQVALRRFSLSVGWKVCSLRSLRLLLYYMDQTMCLIDSFTDSSAKCTCLFFIRIFIQNALSSL